MAGFKSATTHFFITSEPLIVESLNLVCRSLDELVNSHAFQKFCLVPKPGKYFSLWCSNSAYEINDSLLKEKESIRIRLFSQKEYAILMQIYCNESIKQHACPVHKKK